jgi:limonene-1,2-epoxide hydrolase
LAARRAGRGASPGCNNRPALPPPANASTGDDSEAVATVESFLRALEADDFDAAVGMLAPDARWINVTLPEVRGRDSIERILRWSSEHLNGTFRVHLHNLATDGSNVVLTERTDELGRGRFAHRFWVYGRFELRDGKIAIWRDSFDWADVLIGLVRAIAGIAAPRLNRSWPGGR